MLKVKDIMTKDVECRQPSDSIFEAATLMKEEDIGVIPICEENRILGMVTDRDIVLRGIADKHAGSDEIKEVMSTRLCIIEPDASVKEAEAIMADKQVRRLPVVEKDRLVGMISLGDLAVHHQDEQVGCTLEEISR